MPIPSLNDYTFLSDIFRVGGGGGGVESGKKCKNEHNETKRFF